MKDLSVTSKNLLPLKIALVLGAVFFLIGSVVHFFGLTLFPFYDSRLFSLYQDSLIAMSCIFISLLMLTIARDPVKNRDTLKTVIIGVILISVFSILIPLRINFAALGAPLKKMETIIEGCSGLIYALFLFLLYPRE